MAPSLLDEPAGDEERFEAARRLAEAFAGLCARGAPDRFDAEALILRRLIAGGADPAPLKAVWGRLQARTGAAPAVWGGLSTVLAADRFGLGGKACAQAEDALAVAEGGGRALIDLSGARPWWGRLLARPAVRVVMALPDDRHGLPRALLVSREASGPTGDDRTFWVTDAAAPERAIVDDLGQRGLAATPLAASGGLKLMMLAGYVQADDGRLDGAPGSLKGVIGAAPVF